MSKIQKITLGIATLALCIAIGVAIFGGKITIIERIERAVGGVTNYDTLELKDELSFTNASTTNLRLEQATSTPYFKGQKLYIGSIQMMDSWYNDTGQDLHVSIADAGFNSGTASSSYRISLFATSTGPSTIKRLYDYTTLTEAINGSNSFLIKNFKYATSTTATTTNNLQMLKDGSGSGMITVASSSYMHLLIQQGDLIGSCSAGTYNGTCESATSSNRGIGDFFAHFFYHR